VWLVTIRVLHARLVVRIVRAVRVRIRGRFQGLLVRAMMGILKTGWLFVRPAIFRVPHVRQSARIARPAQEQQLGQVQGPHAHAQQDISSPTSQAAPPATTPAPPAAPQQQTAQPAHPPISAP
jgi:hypothetical protein